MLRKPRKRSGPSGANKTPRHNIRVPDPDGLAPAWAEMARGEGKTLGQLVSVLLERHRAKPNK